jgi:shikimate kinase
VKAGSRPIFLVGFMGCGKSAVGQALASRSGRPFVDTDGLVVTRDGRSIERIFAESGEGHFRRVEWESLLEADLADAIVATGGGLFIGLHQRRFILGRGTTVWLDASLESCAGRIVRQGGRPLWGGTELELRALFERRRAVYALARLRVPADGSVQDTVQRVVSRLGPVFP